MLLAEQQGESMSVLTYEVLCRKTAEIRNGTHVLTLTYSWLAVEVGSQADEHISLPYVTQLPQLR